MVPPLSGHNIPGFITRKQTVTNSRCAIAAGHLVSARSYDDHFSAIGLGSYTSAICVDEYVV